MRALRSVLTTLIAVMQTACFASPVHSAHAGELDAIVVIYNRNDPNAKSLADFYCAEREIDPSRQIAVAAPLGEEISREEYDSLIAAPIRQELLHRALWSFTRDMMNRPILYASSVRYAALIKGMPLKIRQTESYPGDAKNQPDPYGCVNAASVDSELSVLGLFTPQISGTLNNPLYTNSPEGIGSERTNIPIPMIMVSRLDAPSDDAVRSMISETIAAEKAGVWGWGYIDLQSTTNKAYARGDTWIREAGVTMRKNGIPVISDDLPETLQAGFPVTDAAAYYGWHDENIDGPFADTSFRFVPGAIAVHLHSFSASTLHDPAKGWTGPLVRHAASISLGNVNEPYLPFTTDLGIFARALLAGHNIAESYYAAQPVLSWMSICVGDPLYRPYAAFQNHEIQSESIWSDYRRIVLSHAGDIQAAAKDLKARAEEKKESLYLEALGAAQMDAGDLQNAEMSFQEAMVYTIDPVIEFRLLLERARSLEKQGRGNNACGLLKENLSRFNTPEHHSLILSWIKRMESPPSSSDPAPSRP
jgi:uncharacterized protein (TIGR03790 family)